MTGSTPTTMRLSMPATGSDAVSTYSHATVSAGDGDDYVLTNDFSVVDGGAGNDAIQVRRIVDGDGGSRAGNDQHLGNGR